MKKLCTPLWLGLICLISACAHPNPTGALDEMVGTVGGAYRNISTAPNP
ncbi:MAG: hypothetical protein Q4G44_05200 [Alcaligenaceae bacterium]|nr:hypothetical protein [Alcaligenaceae bacterium]